MRRDYRVGEGALVGLAWAVIFLGVAYLCGYLVYEAIQMVVAP